LFKNRNDTPIADSRSDQVEKAQSDTSDTNTAVPVTQGDIQGSLGTIRADSPLRNTERKVSDNLNAITLDDNKNKDTLRLTGDLALSELEQAKEERKDTSNGNAVARVQADKVNEKAAKRSLDRPAIDDTGKFYDNKDKEAVESKAKSAEVLAGIAPGRNFAADFTNRYNYRVVDAQNNPVPFANVMNIGDNVGTYTDIRGNFNLISTDSVLNVQIKSLGYLSGNYKLVPSNQFKSLTLKEDIYARREFLDSARDVVSTSSRKDTAELEEPEVGWGYFNTYVANNIQIPDDIRKKSTLSNVELSFDVDKTGQPVNIKVTKSSHCKECDEEAKRLLKEGPKWKRKGKKSKTTISIAVDQK
ncbi:MAG TPA: carboxypeptidase-like regulatory domain-containing protein, partial [Chitinophagaceae bacterium]|nr:carboxypeptidase-like regulatory domain-containing protein [Chitinophagaceae bacterium]